MLYRVDRGFLARRVPHWPESVDWGLTAPVRVYGKAGWGSECVDAGLFETDNGSWILAAMGEALPDSWHRPDDVGPRTLADIGERICRAWSAV